MDLFHIRVTKDVFPVDILYKVRNYVLVSHSQSTFHWHIIAELRDISPGTFRNWMSRSYKGNAEYSVKKCDAGMINYLFHPGSNWSNYKTDYLSDDDKQIAIDASESYFNSLKVKSMPFIDQLEHEVRLVLARTGLHSPIVVVKECLFQLCKKQKRLLPAGSLVTSYITTILMRLGCITAAQVFPDTGLSCDEIVTVNGVPISRTEFVRQSTLEMG